MKITVAGQTDLRVFLSLVNKPLRFNRLGSNYIGENPNVKQPSGLKLIWDRLGEEGRGAGARENTWKEVRSLRTWFQSPPSDTGSTSVDTLAAYRQLSLDDLMQFTCIRQPQKLYYCRLHTVIGMCFWFSLERIIIVLQRKMCKSSLTLHQRGFAPGTWKYYSFYDRRCPWREKKKKHLCCKFTTGEVFQSAYILFNIYLESLRRDLPFEQKPLLL